MEASWASTLELLQRLERLWSRAEVLTRPTPVPPVAGVYGWHLLPRLIPRSAPTGFCTSGSRPGICGPGSVVSPCARASAITSAAMRPDRRCG